MCTFTQAPRACFDNVSFYKLVDPALLLSHMLAQEVKQSVLSLSFSSTKKSPDLDIDARVIHKQNESVKFGK